MFGFLKPGPNQQLDLHNRPSTNHPSICLDVRTFGCSDDCSDPTPSSSDVQMIVSDQNSEQSWFEHTFGSKEHKSCTKNVTYLRLLCKSKSPQAQKGFF